MLDLVALGAGVRRGKRGGKVSFLSNIFYSLQALNVINNAQSNVIEQGMETCQASGSSDVSAMHATG